jgi:large subunit ribosomal protein L27
MGKDHTLFAKQAGAVKYVTKRDDRTYVGVEPAPDTK